MTYIVYKSQGMKKLLFHNLNSFKLICIQEMVFEKKIDYFDTYISSNYDILCSCLVYDIKNLLTTSSKLLILYK